MKVITVFLLALLLSCSASAGEYKKKPDIPLFWSTVFLVLMMYWVSIIFTEFLQH